MKIFLSFLQGKPGHPIPAYGFWEYYIKNGIEEAGFKWVETPAIDWALALVPMNDSDFNNWKDQAWSKTLDFLRKNPCDLFLSYLYPHQIDCNAIAEIRKIGIPTVNFFCDNVREFRRVPEEFRAFDLVWVPEYKALKMYREEKVTHLHLPMPMWVDPKFRIIPNQEMKQVSFIGSHDIQRQLLFEDVMKLKPGFDLNIYGSSWKAGENHPFAATGVSYGLGTKLTFQLDFIQKNGLRGWGRKLQQRNISFPYTDKLEAALKGKPDFEQYTQISQRSLVTLGVNRYPSYRYPLDKPDSYSRLRDIEAPMLGACYLTEWTEGIEEMYQLGQEIEAYHSASELVEKCSLLISNAEKRTELRRKGQIKALEELGIPKTLRKIGEYLGLDKVKI